MYLIIQFDATNQVYLYILHMKEPSIQEPSIQEPSIHFIDQQENIADVLYDHFNIDGYNLLFIFKTFNNIRQWNGRSMMKMLNLYDILSLHDSSLMLYQSILLHIKQYQYQITRLKQIINDKDCLLQDVDF